MRRLLREERIEGRGMLSRKSLCLVMVVGVIFLAKISLTSFRGMPLDFCSFYLSPLALLEAKTAVLLWYILSALLCIAVVVQSMTWPPIRCDTRATPACWSQCCWRLSSFTCSRLTTI